MLKIEVNPHGCLTILSLEGDIDFDGAIKLKDKIQEMRKSGANIVLLNFSGVNTVKSSVLQHLLPPIRALSLVNGLVAICNMSGPVHKFIQTAMFYSMVKVYETEEEAVQEITDSVEKDK